jgi:hypothetical protein
MFFPSAFIHDGHCEWVAQEKATHSESEGCSFFSIERRVKRLPFPLTSPPAIALSFPCRAEHRMLFLRNSFQLD